MGHFWFGDKHRRIIIITNLLLVLLPGFVSLFGLIPITIQGAPYLSWIYSAGFFGAIYFLSALHLFSYARKSKDALANLRELEEDLGRPRRLMPVNGLLLIFTTGAAMAGAFYESSVFFYIAKILLLVIFLEGMVLSTLNIPAILRSYEDGPRKSHNS